MDNTTYSGNSKSSSIKKSSSSSSSSVSKKKSTTKKTTKKSSSSSVSKKKSTTKKTTKKSSSSSASKKKSATKKTTKKSSSSTNNKSYSYNREKNKSKKNNSAPLMNQKNSKENQTEKDIIYKPIYTKLSLSHTGYNKKNMFDNDKPIMIFNIGAVGAGKSKLFKYVKQLLYNIEQNELDINTFSIDNYIQSSNEYKEKVNNILIKYDLKSYNLKPRYLDKMEMNKRKELIKDMTNAYITVKNIGPCSNNDNIDNRSCKEKMMNDIKDKIKNKEDIIIEINGKNIPHKYIDLDKDNDYNIVFTYSLVDYNKLKTRIYNRFISELNGYQFSPDTKKAPRLPSYEDDFLSSHVEEIMKTLITIRNFCLLQDPKKREEKQEQRQVCKNIIGKNNNRINLLIFTNNNENRNRELIYDHRRFDKYITEKQFSDLMESYIYKKK